MRALKSGEWSVNCCDGIFTGIKTAHCTVCHATFTTPGNFDLHRSRGDCLDPAMMVNAVSEPMFRDAGRAYPCWALNSDRPDLEDE